MEALKSGNFRNNPGTNREVNSKFFLFIFIIYLKEWNKWNELSFDEMEGTFSVQQWIQQCQKDYKNVDAILKCPSGIDEGVWKYEHLRQFCSELNGLAVLLQVLFDDQFINI